jgi:hypothetical protein
MSPRTDHASLEVAANAELYVLSRSRLLGSPLDAAIDLFPCPSKRHSLQPLPEVVRNDSQAILP